MSHAMLGGMAALSLIVSVSNARADWNLFPGKRVSLPDKFAVAMRGPGCLYQADVTISATVETGKGKISVGVGVNAETVRSVAPGGVGRVGWEIAISQVDNPMFCIEYVRIFTDAGSIDVDPMFGDGDLPAGARQILTIAVRYSWQGNRHTALLEPKFQPRRGGAPAPGEPSEVTLVEKVQAWEKAAREATDRLKAGIQKMQAELRLASAADAAGRKGEAADHRDAAAKLRSQAQAQSDVAALILSRAKAAADIR